MTPTRLILLPATQDAPTRWLRADAAGTLLDHGHVGDAPLPEAPRTVLALPTTDIALHRLDLAARTAAQARAAAALLLPERLAVAPARLHVAVAPAGDGAWRVAAMEAACLDAALARAAELGVVPDAVVPDALLLPVPDADAPPTVVALDGTWRVRGNDLAFAAEPALAARVLGDPAPAPLAGGPALALLAAGTATAMLDLRQGAFAPAATAPRPGLRRLAALAALLALSPVALSLATAFADLREARRLDAMARERAAALLGTPPADPALALRRHRATLEQAGSATLLLDALADAASAAPAAELVAAQLGPDGVLRASFAGTGPGDDERLRAALEAQGVLALRADAPAHAGRPVLAFDLRSQP
ncbi:type II secretion system protein GspL [Coralloluteibacterium thermophilus]|uniref:Type II secretion system protein GspL n=1 Tax=Coralloluteibacterium thermophilum TaxID=2707049 RepID=A0ABV9NNS6_9GAMM